MGTVTDLYTLATPHRKAIIEKADRAMAVIDEWTDNHVRMHGVTKAQALEDMRTALTNTGEAGVITWNLMASLHHERFPDHPGKETFDTSRDVILAKLDARIWSAARAQDQDDSDPFDRLTS